MYVTLFHLPASDSRQLLAPPVWSDSQYICALSDDDRHLGHVVEDIGWHAYDAIHPNSAQGGLCYLGQFENLLAAKRAVELSTGYWPEGRMKSVSAGTLYS